jgi:hypothetical protein
MIDKTKKKIIIITSISLVALLATGFGSYMIWNNQSNVPPSYGDFDPDDYLDDNTLLFADFESFRLESPTLENYIERYNPCDLFNLAVYESQKNDFIKFQASGLVDVGGLKQDILTYQLKNVDRYFYESISKGLISVAKRFYQDDEITWYRGKYNQSKEMVWNPESETVVSIEDFQEVWGFDLSIFSPYIVSSLTCLETSTAVIEDEKIQISLDLDPFFSVLNYVKQMVKMGNLEEAPIFKNINLKITFDENFLIQSTEIFEQYKVKKFGWFDATGTISGDFTFGIQEAFPPLETEIIYQ